MPVTVVIGSQWGDEGKGKVTDFIAEKADVIVRYQGGSNAGHTINIKNQVFKLKLIPSGILYPDKICILGNGMVIDPAALLEEMDALVSRGVNFSNLYISDRAQIIMPYHCRLDYLAEKSLGDNQIGTTQKGIGPAYMDKYSRLGIRVSDLITDFRGRLQAVLQQKNVLLKNIYGESGYNFDELVELYGIYADRLAPHVKDVSLLLQEANDTGKRIVLEGAQGTMLDIDHGTYPYVTSSNPTAGGACIGSGLPPAAINQVVGVVKAYTTRVGEGPFPTELTDETGTFLREQGVEFGTVTGRPRRVGWLDGIILRYASRLNGFSKLIVTKLDVLTGLEKIGVCIGYQYGGKILGSPPASLDALAECSPEYKWLSGWDEDLSQCSSYSKLPREAKEYLDFIEDYSKVKIALVSVGAQRDQTIVREDVFK